MVFNGFGFKVLQLEKQSNKKNNIGIILLCNM